MRLFSRPTNERRFWYRDPLNPRSKKELRQMLADQMRINRALEQGMRERRFVAVEIELNGAPTNYPWGIKKIDVVEVNGTGVMHMDPKAGVRYRVRVRRHQP